MDRSFKTKKEGYEAKNLWYSGPGGNQKVKKKSEGGLASSSPSRRRFQKRHFAMEASNIKGLLGDIMEYREKC